LTRQPEFAIGTDDRRSATRLHLQIPVFVRGTDAHGQDFIELAKTLDISATGAYLTLPRPPGKHGIVTLTIPTPQISSSGLIPAAMAPIAARVVRQKEVGDVQLVAVQFVRPIE
jgi:PilZ domain